MLLNLGKVERMLLDNKFIISSFYVYQGKCKYIKVFSMEHGETLFIHIDSDYTLQVNYEEMKQRGNEVFDMQLVDIKQGDNILERYNEYPKEKSIEEKYKQISQEGIKFGDNLEEDLENSYKKKIFLTEQDKVCLSTIKDCSRQLKRFSMCIQELHYNLSITQGQCLCIKESDYVNYFVKKQEGDKRLMYIVVDLEVFYEKGSQIISDMDDIKQGIYKVLDKNQDTGMDNLFNLLETFNTVDVLVNNLKKKKKECQDCVKKYKKLLKDIVSHEEEVIKQLYKVDNDNKDYFGDASRLQQKAMLQDKLRSIQSIKQKIIKNMTSANQQTNDIYLKVDKCEFDNTVLVDTIRKNLKELEE